MGEELAEAHGWRLAVQRWPAARKGRTATVPIDVPRSAPRREPRGRRYSTGRRRARAARPAFDGVHRGVGRASSTSSDRARGRREEREAHARLDAGRRASAPRLGSRPRAPGRRARPRAAWPRGISTANSSPPKRATMSLSRSRLRQHLRHADSTRSPARWPCSSLTALEVVQVEHDQRAAHPVAAPARDVALQLLLEAAPVEQAGEGVVVGHVAQRRLDAVRARPASHAGGRPRARPRRPGRSAR